MRIVINTNDLDVNLTEFETSKLTGEESKCQLVKCINMALADISLPALNDLEPGVIREGAIVDDAPNHYRICFEYEHPMDANINIMQINDICWVVDDEGTTVLRTPAGVDLRISDSKKKSCYHLSNIVYRTRCEEYEYDVELTFGETCIDLYREKFMRMILDMDADATIIGANTAFSRVIKLESIDVGITAFDDVFTAYPPKPIAFNAPPVCVNYSGRGFFIKHIAFDTVGRYSIRVGKDVAGIGHCYAPGYVRMEEGFQASTPIVANNIAQLEQCMAITGALNEKIVTDLGGDTNYTNQVNWYAKDAFYESERANDGINSKLDRTVAMTSGPINDYIAGGPGYDRLYNIFSEIERFKACTTKFDISNKEVVELLCSGFGIDLGIPSSISGDVHQKGRKMSTICGSLNVLDMRVLPVGDVAEAYYNIIEQILPLEERGMDMEEVLTGLFYVMADADLCHARVIDTAVEEFDDLYVRNTRHARFRRRGRTGRVIETRSDRDRRSSPRDRFNDHRFRGELRAQGLRNAFDVALAAVPHDSMSDTRLYRTILSDIESIADQYEGIVNLSAVGNIIAHALNVYCSSNPYVAQCGNKTLDCIISDLVKVNSDKLSVGDMLEFINPAGVRDVISKIDTYVDELRAYIVEDGKVHL